MFSFIIKTCCLNLEIFSKIKCETILLYSFSFTKDTGEAGAGLFFFFLLQRLRFNVMCSNCSGK